MLLVLFITDGFILELEKKAGFVSGGVGLSDSLCSALRLLKETVRPNVGPETIKD